VRQEGEDGGPEHPGQRHGGTDHPPARHRTDLGSRRPEPEARQGSVVQQEEAEDEHQVVEEGIVGREDDADLEHGADSKAGEAEWPRQPGEPDEDELQDEREERGGGVEAVRELVDVPADPGGQRTGFVVVVHRGQMPPLLVAAHQLDQARFEIDPEPLPAQQEKAGLGRRAIRREARP